MANHNATIGKESLKDVQIAAGDNCVTRTYDFHLPISEELEAGHLMGLTPEMELVPFDSTISGTTIGNGDDATTDFSNTLGAVMPGTLTITDRIETFTDNGGGILVSDAAGISGNVDYSTGAFAISFKAAPAVDVPITADHKPVPAGILKRTAEVGDTEGDVITFGQVNRKHLKVGEAFPSATQLRLLETKHIYPV
ncbi:hypothetical protein [Desulfovibrio sp. UCD-KL4C]|uniref:hypothetical protein n=1 Tax=Desulfovibrio sp. UCD-KL4C TaxID=2578120 RepID=UPI0025C6EAA1|nr:hypothetical protein [Desulfovibrio sp. UCD-KL4C]